MATKPRMYLLALVLILSVYSATGRIHFGKYKLKEWSQNMLKQIPSNIVDKAKEDINGKILELFFEPLRAIADITAILTYYVYYMVIFVLAWVCAL